MKPHRGDPVYAFAAALSAQFTVIQIEPLGFGWSDRPDPHPPVQINEQVDVVLEREGVDRFVVWGYSAGGAMALAVGRSSPRATAVVCGGWSPAERSSEAELRRMDREQRAPMGQREFWHWHSRFDWLHELATMQVPRLVYVGTADDARVRGPRGITRTRPALIERGVTVLEFDGLDHTSCMNEPAFSTRVAPAVLEWLDQNAA